MGGIIIFTAIAVPFLLLTDYSTGASVGVFGVALACARWASPTTTRSSSSGARSGCAGGRSWSSPMLISIGLWLVATRGRGPAGHAEPARRSTRRSTSATSIRSSSTWCVAGTTSAVNLTDGLDGLAAGCAAIVLLAYIAITFTTGQTRARRWSPACLVGACVGFLWFNSFPASIFMGDTGSLGLGRRDRRRWR